MYVVYCILHPTKNDVEFPGVFKIEQLQVEFPWVLVFHLGISKGVTHICRTYSGESYLVFSRNSVINDHMIHHDSMIHGPLIVLYDVLYCYFITIKYVYIYLILFLFNSFYIQYLVYFIFLSVSGWDTCDMV